MPLSKVKVVKTNGGNILQTCCSKAIGISDATCSCRSKDGTAFNWPCTSSSLPNPIYCPVRSWPPLGGMTMPPCTNFRLSFPSQVRPGNPFIPTIRIRKNLHYLLYSWHCRILQRTWVQPHSFPDLTMPRLTLHTTTCRRDVTISCETKKASSPFSRREMPRSLIPGVCTVVEPTMRQWVPRGFCCTCRSEILVRRSPLAMLAR
mmetsp:Transcript_7478/g.16969  ORF Transcript_7478/g.16969 Transcript_7478/m.16969 type:complete len:204 (+) Transcript_7478:638-1249(+)